MYSGYLKLSNTDKTVRHKGVYKVWHLVCAPVMSNELETIAWLLLHVAHLHYLYI